MSQKPPTKSTLNVPRGNEVKGSARIRADESTTGAKRAGDEAAFAIPLKVLRPLLDRVSRSIFKVVTESGSQGTGAFYAVHDDVDEGHTLCCFITCHHVLATSARDEVCGAELHFEGLPLVTLERDWIAFCWTSSPDHLDATVVELTPEALSALRSLGADTLTIGDAVPGARVALVQYPRGELSFGYGSVEAVEPPDLYYHIGADCGSSGSPVLDWEARAIGIHKRADKPATPMAGASVDPLGYQRFATSLSEIVYAYLSDRRISLSLSTGNLQAKLPINEMTSNFSQEEEDDFSKRAAMARVREDDFDKFLEQVIATTIAPEKMQTTKEKLPDVPPTAPKTICWRVLKRSAGVRIDSDDRLLVLSAQRPAFHFALLAPENLRESPFSGVGVSTVKATFRLVRNPSHKFLEWGVVMMPAIEKIYAKEWNDAVVPLEWEDINPNGWFLTSSRRLYGRGHLRTKRLIKNMAKILHGGPKVGIIPENSIVTIEFDVRRRSIRFTTPGLGDSDIADWIDTRLGEQEFRTIAPVVVLFNPGDAVEIVD